MKVRIKSVPQQLNRNASKWKHGLGGNLFSGEEEGSQQMIITHKPYYDTDGTLLYNRTLPEIVIIPDSQLSPAERNYKERQRQKNLSDYAEHKDKEYTKKQTAKAQKEWNSSFEKQALDYGQAIASGIGVGADMVSGLPIYSSLKGASTLSRAETPMDYVESGLWLSPMIGTVGKTAYDTAKPVVNKAINNATVAWALRNPQVPEEFITIKPKVITKVGDVEVNNPNILYHLDRGNGAGAFSNQGAYIEDGFLFPGTPKEPSTTPYSWWNKGKPFALGVNGQPMTRLMTATEDTPGMIHIKSQNYPIGQWDGKRGLVRNTEYVNPSAVNVSSSTYTLEPNYGWRRVFAEESPVAEWPVGSRANFSNPDIRYDFNPFRIFKRHKAMSEDEVIRGLQEAKDYKESDGYNQLVRSFIEETGESDIPTEIFYNSRHSKMPKIVFEERPEGSLGGYRYSTNTLSVDPKQAVSDVPIHEGFHWQRVGEVPNVRVNNRDYKAWAEAYHNNAPDETQRFLFSKLFKSGQLDKLNAQQAAIENLYKQKVDAVVKPSILDDAEMRKPYELVAHSMGAGKEIGLKLFQEFPGVDKARKVIKRAKRYDPYLDDIKSTTDKDVRNFWKLLTANYLPATTIGINTVGLGLNYKSE